jgi:hypothetical protein
MMSRSLVRVLVPLLILGACGGHSRHEADGDGDGDRDADSDEHLEHDNATLRAAAMNEWYTESKTVHRTGGTWTRDYRTYLLDVARAERLRWPELMPGSKVRLAIGGSQWTSIGPTDAHSGANGSSGAVTDSGRISAIVADGARLFVATAGGGVWRRDGSTWKPLSETIGTLSCGALAIDPTNHQRLYLGLGDAFDGTGVGLVITTDGGDTWSDPVFLGDSMRIQQIVVDPTDASIVLAATDRGLYRSTNAGASWTLVPIATGAADPPMVWSLASTGGPNFVLSLGSLEPDTTTSTTAGQVWWSSNDGSSWTQSSGVTASGGLGRITVGASPSTPQTVYAMAAATTDLADLFKSTDGGKTWTALAVANKNYTNGGGKVGGLLNGQGGYNQLVLVDATNPSVVYFGGALLLAKTSDGGKTFRAASDWVGQGLPYVHADIHAGAVDGSGKIYIGTDGGVFLSADAAATFTDSLNVGLVTHLLYSVGSSPAGPSAVIGGMQDNGTRVREANTTIYDEVIGGDGFGAAIHRTNAQLMLGSLYYDQIARSSDGGANWDDATTGIAEAGDENNAPFITQIIEGPAANGNEVYTHSMTRVYKSTNFGSSWTKLPVDVTDTPEIRSINVAASNSQIVGVVASGGRVFLSKNGGASWTTVASGKSPDATALPNSDRSLSWIQFDVTDPNIVYVSSVAPEASVNHLWKSTDFGASWTALDGSGLPAGVPINEVKSDPIPAPGTKDRILYAATHLGVYRTLDGGATWARFGAGMPLVNVTDLYIAPDESIVRASTFGRGFWQLDPGEKAFAIAVNPGTVTIPQGETRTATVGTAVLTGSAQDIALSVMGVPDGATATFSAPSVTTGDTSTLTITAATTTPPGTYLLSIRGVGTTVDTATLTVEVTASADFSVAATPATVTIAQGASGTAAIASTGPVQSISLAVSGLPTGATGTFAPASMTTGESSTLTIAVDAATPTGTYPLTITGTGPTAAHTTPLVLEVSAAGGNPPGGCCSIGASRSEAAGNALIALGVVGLVFARRRRRGARA